MGRCKLVPAFRKGESTIEGWVPHQAWRMEKHRLLVDIDRQE